MALRIADQFRIDVVPEALIAYREHNQRITSHSFRAFRYWWLRVRLSGSLSRSGQITYAQKRWLYHLQGLYEVFGLGLLIVTARRQAHHTREYLRRTVKATLFRAYILFIKPLHWFPLRPGIMRRKKPNAGPGLCAYYIWCFPTPSETFIRRELTKVSEADIPVMVVAETRHPETDSGSMPQIPRVAVHFIDESGSEDLQTGYYRIRRQNRFRFWYLYLYTMCHRYGFYQSPTEDMAVVKQAAILAGFLGSKNVTHIHTPWADRSAFIAMLAADLLNITYSVQARAHELHRKHHAFGLKEKLGHASFVITNSRYNHDLIASMLSKSAQERVHLMYEGVSPGEMTPISPTKQISGPLQILSVARLIEEKGLLFLLLACDELRRRGIAFECEIVGGSERPTYTAYEMELRMLHRQLGLESMVSFSGSQPLPEVLMKYQKADVVVLPCVRAANGGRDITPNTLIEALAYGVPTVSTESGAIPEIIDDGVDGLLVPPANPAALADAIQRLAEDPVLRERLSRNARKKVEDRFDLTRNIVKLTGLLQSQSG
jgi:glycosyltransferase involved in cell wall biosynthesis